MNPFDLRGPQFLVFYVGLIVVVNVILRLWRSRVGAGDAVPELTDPYLIACLRGGQAEAVRVGIVSLIDRGLLQQSDQATITLADPAAVERVRRPFERALLQSFATAAPAWRALARGANPDLDRTADGLREELERLGLVSGGMHRPTMLVPTLGGLAILLVASGLKIQVALARGKHNLGFLIILTIIGSIVTLRTLSPYRTAAGTAALVALKRRFAGLRQRADELKPGGETNEAVLLAALFGVGALPALAFPYTRELFPRSGDSGVSSTGGCGGSGCSGGGGGGGSDGGGGSSCGGGGGCGGGCGGCGG